MDEVKRQLIKHLNGGEAFTPLGQLLEDIDADKVGERPHGLPYSIYELLYHITYAQKDILDFCVSDAYKTPQWPEDYWPSKSKPTASEWQNLIDDYFAHREQLTLFIRENDLTKVVKNGDDQTLLREVMLVIEHTAYHTGQMVVLLRLLGAYEE